MAVLVWAARLEVVREAEVGTGGDNNDGASHEKRDAPRVEAPAVHPRTHGQVVAEEQRDVQVDGRPRLRGVARAVADLRVGIAERDAQDERRDEREAEEQEREGLLDLHLATRGDGVAERGARERTGHEACLTLGALRCADGGVRMLHCERQGRLREPPDDDPATCAHESRCDEGVLEPGPSEEESGSGSGGAEVGVVFHGVLGGEGGVVP